MDKPDYFLTMLFKFVYINEVFSSEYKVNIFDYNCEYFHLDLFITILKFKIYFILSQVHYEPI